jgi:cytochrome c
MELNKIFAAVLVAGILGMMVGFISESLVAPEGLEQAAYRIETGEGPAEVPQEDEVEMIPSIIPLLVTADPEAGEDLTRACTACHNFEQGGPNGVGPNNWGVVGASVAHVEDFNYSSALSGLHDAGVEWTYENLNRFLYAPRDWAPGTSMSYAGMDDAEDRANLIAWLRLQADEPEPLPTEEEAAALEGAMVAVTETGPAEPPGEAEEETEETAAEGEGPAEGQETEGAGEDGTGDAAAEGAVEAGDDGASQGATDDGDNGATTDGDGAADDASGDSAGGDASSDGGAEGSDAN